MKDVTEEEKFMERIIPEIEERVQYKIVRNIIDILEEQFYPPEEMIRQEFIERIEEAEKEVGKVFKDKEELKAYLDNLAEKQDV